MASLHPPSAAWHVHKFGGTSVGSWQRIKAAADIAASQSSAPRIFVVVSAMAGVTNSLYRLLQLAEARDETYTDALNELHAKHRETAEKLLEQGEDLRRVLEQLEDDVSNLRAMLRAAFIVRHSSGALSDFVVGHGELWNARLLSAVIRKSGRPCAFLDARDVLVVDSSPPSSSVHPLEPPSLLNLEKWWQANSQSAGATSPSSPCSIVATGFIARTSDGVPTTLRRDGSDFSATIFASLLKAALVTIWTDVDGVFSADPRRVRDAVVLPSLSYQEAWEMSYFGASVLHPRTTLPVMRHAIPILIRNALNLQASGTRISNDSHETHPLSAQHSLEGAVVKGFATIPNVALINVEGTGMAGVPGTASDIFAAAKGVGANVIAISQASSEHSICFAVPQSEATSVAAAVQAAFRGALEAGQISKVEVISNCSVMAAVGQKMASTPGVSAALFSSLAKAGVNVRAIAQGCSEYNITVVVDQSDVTVALNAAHSHFYSPLTRLHAALIGPGLIGACLLQQIAEQASFLRSDCSLDLQLVAIANSKQMLLSKTGIDLSSWQQQWQQSEQQQAVDLEALTSHLRSTAALSGAACLIIDSTASSDIAAKYSYWAQNKCHVITPNKRAGSGPMKEWLALKAATRLHGVRFFSEASVGAGLPLLGTLESLTRSGDKIKKIEGIFSGTLSFIFNSFSSARSFSSIVAEAKARGFTEPDPRDDLSGMDVARKVVILARLAGLSVDLDSVHLDSLVPATLKSIATAAEFMQRLPEFDSEMARQQQEAEAAGNVLRYVGAVDITSGSVTVSLRQYPIDHPFASLQGSDNIVAFHTARYSPQPLIVRGPGAGAEVTAGGVFSDILRLASHLGASC